MKDIEKLFKNLCCSRCKNDFTQESIKIIEKKNNILICNLFCHKCGKDFGNVILNYSANKRNHPPLEIIDGPPAINADDVLDAHRFIKNNLK